MADKFLCRLCRKTPSRTKADRYRTHTGTDGQNCDNSGAAIPSDILAQADTGPADVPKEGTDWAVCPDCGRKVELTPLGYLGRHDKTLRGGDNCPTGGTRYINLLKRTETVELPPAEVDRTVEPVDAQPVKDHRTDSGYGMVPLVEIRLPVGPKELPVTAQSNLAQQPMESALPAGSGASTETNSPESSTTLPLSQEWTEVWDSFFLASAHLILMDAVSGPEEPVPVEAFDDLLFEKRPSKYPPRSNKPMRKMTEREREIAARIRETFYAYTNRNSSDNRSAQTTIGPSEAGSPCDRQIAMKLLNIEPVNPQEGWAPFVGTAVHAELAKMFQWANGGGSGRYVTEMRVSFGDPHVPYGTLDLLDRVLYMVDDHKLLGRWSLEQLRKEGPSETYRKQIQIYGLGAELAGETVREVAIIAWPRQESSLDKLFVHVEPYDRRVAEEALERVSRIADEIAQMSGRVAHDGTGPASPMEAAASFETGDDCKWCPFHQKGDKRMERGCPGQ